MAHAIAVAAKPAAKASQEVNDHQNDQDRPERHGSPPSAQAAGAAMGAGAMLMLVFAGERPLGGLFAQHGILHRGQLLAPIGFVLHDLVGGLGLGHGYSLPNRR